MNLRRTAFLIALMSTVNVSNCAGGAYAQTGAKHDAKIAMGYGVSGPFSFGNLSIFLIRGTDKLKNKQYLTLPEAIARKLVVVNETGNVNALTIDNLSDAVVFIQSGEIVKGGQQDRALQSDMLIPSHSKGVSLPCFCVEHGRWQGRVGESSSKFDSANNFVVGNGTNRALRKDGDQSKVWEQVAAKQQQLSQSLTKPVAAALSPTSLQLTLEHKSVKDATQMQYSALADVVNREKDAIGYAVAINGTISNADVYASGSLLKKLWPGLLKSAVIEAVAQKGKGVSSKKLPTPSEVKIVLADAQHFRPDPSAPYRNGTSLQGATNGTIGPQGGDATYVTGVNTAGTVRSNSPLDFFFRTTDKNSGVVIHENFLGK